MAKEKPVSKHVDIHKVKGLAAEIAKAINFGWCSQFTHRNCMIYFTVATKRRSDSGKRIWNCIGGTSIEHLELITTLHADKQLHEIEHIAEYLSSRIREPTPDIQNE